MTKAEVRSPAAKIGGLFYFGRMLDKIRVHEQGKLPAEYVPNLGKGFDASCTGFLRLPYEDLVARVRGGGSDDEILAWCFQHGHHPSEEEIFVWNEFMRKRGWDDEITPTLAKRKVDEGLANRADIATMFQFIDADESRL